VVGTYLNSMF